MQRHGIREVGYALRPEPAIPRKGSVQMGKVLHADIERRIRDLLVADRDRQLCPNAAFAGVRAAATV